jgi:tRNA (guanine37-N1)-methyltransferase
VSLQIDVLTLSPQQLDAIRETRPVGNVLDSGELDLRVFDLRDWGLGTYRQVDDAPYGGGAGMLLRVDVVCAALEAIYSAPVERVRADRRVVVLAPVGRPFAEAVAVEYAAGLPITLLCGRYEGFDQRVHDHLATEELSIGPYVLSGGELAAMVVIDAVTRRLPGALGKADSHRLDSFSPEMGGRPEHPHYTRPEQFRGWRVPPVLLSGDHGRVAEWREQRSRSRDASDL